MNNARHNAMNSDMHGDRNNGADNGASNGRGGSGKNAPRSARNGAVFIIGGASGIGQGLACLYAAAGESVTLFDRQPMDATLAAMRAVAPASDPFFAACTIDVCDAALTRSVIAQAAAVRAPRLVIHCAGVAAAVPFSAMPAEDFARVVNINLIGTANVAAAALPLLAGGGQLVLTASMAGLVGCYGYTAYSASKFGVVGLAEVLRMEARLQGITVTLVCPPEVETPMVVEERLTRPRRTALMKQLAGSLARDEACRLIRNGIEARRYLVIPGRKARLVWLASRWLPAWINHRISDLMLARIKE